MNPGLTKPSKATIVLVALRYLIIIGLIGLLLLLGYFDHPFQDWLTAKWYWLAQDTTGWLSHLNGMLQQRLPQAVAKRPLPVLLTFLGIYMAVSVLLLRLLLLQPPAWRLAWRTYAGVVGVYVMLLLLAKLGAGHLPWAYPLARLVVELLGTPIPVAVLVILLRYGMPTSTY